MKKKKMVSRPKIGDAAWKNFHKTGVIRVLKKMRPGENKKFSLTKG